MTTDVGSRNDFSDPDRECFRTHRNPWKNQEDHSRPEKETVRVFSKSRSVFKGAVRYLAIGLRSGPITKGIRN